MVFEIYAKNSKIKDFYSLGKVHLIWQGGGMKILKLEAWNFSCPPH